MSTGMCFVCGQRLKDAMGRVVLGVERFVDGNKVRMHKVCSKTFDNDAKRYVRQTDQISTEENPK